MSTDTPNVSELLRWWHRYQAQSLNEFSDGIRNGLLQDLFTVRRQMELSCPTLTGDAETCCHQHLIELESIYAQLENLSSHLYSPYLEDSLPLALEHALQPWQSQLPLELQFAPRWEVEPIEQTRLLIGLTQSLLTALTEDATLPHGCDIVLTQQRHKKILRYHMTYKTEPPLALWPALPMRLRPFLETFRIFTAGEYEQILQPREFGWVLCWSANGLAPA